MPWRRRLCPPGRADKYEKGSTLCACAEQALSDAEWLPTTTPAPTNSPTIYRWSGASTEMKIGSASPAWWQEELGWTTWAPLRGGAEKWTPSAEWGVPEFWLKAASQSSGVDENR